MSYGNRCNRYGRGSYGGGRDRGYGSSYGNQGSKPVEAGKEYNVEVTELSRRGDGVAKIQGFIIFVRRSKVGDKVRIKVESVGPRFATANSLGPITAKTSDASKNISPPSGSTKPTS